MLETEVRVERTTPYLLRGAACAASRTLVSGLPRVRSLAATVVAVGLGWVAVVALPIARGGDAEQPPVLLAALGGAALVVALGLRLGADPGCASRGVVRHPWWSVGAHAAAWPVAGDIIGGTTYAGVPAAAVVGRGLRPVPSDTLGGVGSEPGGAGAPGPAPAVGVAADPGRAGCARADRRAGAASR